MQKLIGPLLHKKSFTSKKGVVIPVISILDEHQKFSEVIDLTDFDNSAAQIDVGQMIEVPFRSRPNTSKKGELFINYVVDGEPQLLERFAD